MRESQKRSMCEARWQPLELLAGRHIRYHLNHDLLTCSSNLTLVTDKLRLS